MSSLLWLSRKLNQALPVVISSLFSLGMSSLQADLSCSRSSRVMLLVRSWRRVPYSAMTPPGLSARGAGTLASPVPEQRLEPPPRLPPPPPPLLPPPPPPLLSAGALGARRRGEDSGGNSTLGATASCTV